MKNYLNFVDITPIRGRKTNVFEVWSNKVKIGIIKWSFSKGSYCFFPFSDVAIDSEEMQKILDKIKELNWLRDDRLIDRFLSYDEDKVVYPQNYDSNSIANRA